jgi:ABC-type ATPase with predicted acetyltransferase domain
MDTTTTISTTKTSYPLTINVSFSTSTERDPRVLKVAESFGIGLEDRQWPIFKDFQIEVQPGDVVYINGQSGSGKSSLLREMEKGLKEIHGLTVTNIDQVVFEDRPVISQIGKSLEEATQLLALAGLSDAYLYIRKPCELSDGQKYRFRLAKMLEANADVWVADEFGAILDRITAKVVANNFQKVARTHGKIVIVATTHTDLVAELAPSLLIEKRFQDRVEVSRHGD